MHNPEVHGLLKRVTDENARRGNGYIDLTYCDISGKDFSGLNLSNVIMSFVTAEHAIFAECNLADTKLDHANLDYADFRGANLEYSKLYGSSIKGANFCRANLLTTYGLGLTSANQDTVKRLGIVSNIMGAVLPERVEALRFDIQEMINKRNPRLSGPSPITQSKLKGKGGKKPITKNYANDSAW